MLWMETKIASTAQAVLPGLLMDPAEWECAGSLLELTQVKLCKCQRDLHSSKARTLLQFSMERLQHVHAVGEGKEIFS